MQTVGIVGLGALGVLFGQRLLENGADQETLAAVCQNRRFSVERKDIKSRALSATARP